MNTDSMMKYIIWGLTNFGFVMIGFAIVFMLLHKIVSRGTPEAEIVFRWMAFFVVGLTGLYAFVMHAFFPALTAASIGWSNSPFQFEVACANLAFGVLGILSFKASYAFRLAMVIGLTCWLWGDAAGHLYQILTHKNYMPGNAGTWFDLDILLPLILIICLVKLREKNLMVPHVINSR